MQKGVAYTFIKEYNFTDRNKVFVDVRQTIFIEIYVYTFISVLYAINFHLSS
jgi:hypothetical protein